MNSLVALTGWAVVLFASTNIDDVFVLVGFFADQRMRTRDIVLGQYAGFAFLFCVSLAASLLSLVIPRAYFGLLGVVPILIGGKKFLDLNRKRDETESDLTRRTAAGGGRRVVTVTMVTIANGGDNIGIYTPAFAIHSGREIGLIALVFVLMTTLWCLSANAMVNHPRLGSPVRRIARRFTPIVFIALGLVILYQSGSFGLLRASGH